jgi:hypothetical protein
MKRFRSKEVDRKASQSLSPTDPSEIWFCTEDNKFNHSAVKYRLQDINKDGQEGNTVSKLSPS